MQQRRSARLHVRSATASPHTPGGGHHDRINSIVENLERHWHLGLIPRDKTWSPQHSALRREPPPQYQCSQWMRRLYFCKDPSLLDKALSEFETKARGKAPKDRLLYLHHLLGEAMKRVPPPDRTPLQNRLEQVAPSPQCASDIRPVPSSVFNRPQASTEMLPQRWANVSDPATELSAMPQVRDENMPSYAANEQSLESLFAATQPDTPPAAEDEEPGEAPPSPSLQASTRKKDAPGPIERGSRHTRRGKRCSDTSTESERSPKQQRTSSEANRKSEGSFAVPDSPLPRRRQTESSRSSSSSRRVSEATRNGSTTSFASTTSNLSRTDSIFSHNGDGGKTANTSFATSVDASQPEKIYPSQPERVHRSQPDKAQQEFPSSGNYSADTDIPWSQLGETANELANEPADETTNEPVDEPTEEARFLPGDSLEKLIEKSTYESLPSSANIVSSAKPQEQHQAKALPAQGLFVPKIGAKLMKMEFKYRWEFLRVALEAGIEQPEALLPRNHNEEWNDYSCLWDYFRHHDALGDCFEKLRRSSEKAWDAAEVIFENNTVKAFENITLKAKLSFTDTNQGPIFKIRLQPLQLEEASCRFQRAFGGDRFLYLETPEFRSDKLPEHLKGQLPSILVRFQEWLGFKNKELLGRRWETIHIEPIKEKKSKSRPQDEGRGYRVILFATSGSGIDPEIRRTIKSGTRHTMSVYDLVNWFMPLDNEKNARQPYLKAFARISLGLTTTLPALEFEPKQVRFVKDIKANNEYEDCEFNDEGLDWPEDGKTNRVMNDGCSRISVGAARRLWKNINKDGPIPSTFQGRIGGAKGMWMLSASPDTIDRFHSDVWIEVSDSQLKFEPHKDDSDPLRLTFDLHSTTGTAEPSSVYLSFFPILQDRKVPAHTLKKIFEDHLNKERNSLLEAIQHPVHLRKWVNEQHALAEERAREDEISWQGGMPHQLQEKVVLLLESGFDTSCEYLANVTQRLVARSLRLLRQNVRVPLPRCTYIKGVADPYGILAPGEIHVQFTKSFIDEASGECLGFLDKRDILVARNPALRRSDIQKVRACFKLELSHLKDVVVFPTRGSFPLAGKLQGGDYDGDTFWVCWEPELVEPFKNAPPPLDDPVPTDYGIKVDKRTLEQMKERRSIGNFLRESFKFRCKPNLLGQATKLHEKVYYREKSLVSEKAEALADLHDLLVDYSKNGYEFDEADFDAFRARYNIPKNMPKPLYEQARDQDRDEKKLNAGKKKPGKNGRKEAPPAYNTDSILDILYFETIKPHTDKTLHTLEKHLQTTAALAALANTDVDPALEAPFLNELAWAKDEGDDVHAEELAALTEEMNLINDLWNVEVNRRKNAFGAAGLMSPGSNADGVTDDANNEDLNNPDSYNNAVDVCHPRFRAARPQLAAQSAVVRRWEREHAKAMAGREKDSAPPVASGAPTYWELLRASALYHVCGKKIRRRRARGFAASSTFVFHMAGLELCWIKASSAAGGVRPVVGPMWANMKPRKIKAAGSGARAGGWGEAGESKKGRVADDGERAGRGKEGDETEYASAAEEIGEGDDE